MKNIVNIINFVRGIEPREGRNIDLEEPVIEQIRIMRENGLRGTFLLQYDALIAPKFRKIIADCVDFCEIGLWLEIVQPLVEDIGEEWHGRYAWDWYNDVGFLIGYEPQVRIRLIDQAMKKFKELYGRYPESVGSWHIDAVSMRYLAEKYGVVACCICREQVGMDGYTMQGGYYNQAYYPSINNMFCPAKTAQNQISMPVFRMLGSDPVIAYDHQVFGYGIRYCPTLEPAQLGRDKSWCDWFLEETFHGNGISFAYTHAGQENSFGWQNMRAGIEYQFPKIAELARKEEVEVLTLGECGKYYKEHFLSTPPSAVVTDCAWNRPDMRSIWYCSKYYRVNLLIDKGVARIRDMYVFDEEYQEHYLNKRCTTHACEFRNLPVMDGSLYSNVEKEIVAGIYMTQDGKPIEWTKIEYNEISDDTATVDFTGACGTAKLTLSESRILLETNIAGFTFMPVYDRERAAGTVSFADRQYANHNNGTTVITFVTKAEKEGNRICFMFDGFDYAVTVEAGEIREELAISTQEGRIYMCF